MSFNSYYQEELAALRELGREFARLNPGLAPFLATPGRDPDVERLMEGFAFLTGRLRQKLDDELPEITHALFNLLWPNYLRPVPSCSIVQYTPTEMLTKSITIPRGTKVDSVPIDGTTCSFSTVYDTDVYPIALNRLGVQEKDGRAVLVLGFDVINGTLDNLEFDHMKLYLDGETGLATSLYHLLIKKVSQIKVCIYGDDGLARPVIVLEPKFLQAVGFNEAEAMLPYPSNTFPGYRLLQEYFCFTEKFMFVELSGLADFVRSLPDNTRENKSFEIQLWLTEWPDDNISYQANNLKLFCSPVVNLFKYDSAPIIIDQQQSEYRIVPDAKRPQHLAVYSVDRVSSWSHSNKSDVDYAPFESFEHGNIRGSAPAYYRLRIKPALYDGGTETYISVIYISGNEVPAAETISLELTCTNSLLPQKLSLGDISISGDKATTHVVFKNIKPVTSSYAPPLGGDLPWRLISNMSLNYISLVNIEALKSVISTYDFRALHDKRRARILDQTLSGMVKVESESIDRIYRGLPIRGARTFLTLSQKSFTSEGDMFLFGSIINEFLALYATVNSFHELVLIEEKRGEQYKWPARLGNSSF